MESLCLGAWDMCEVVLHEASHHLMGYLPAPSLWPIFILRQRSLAPGWAAGTPGLWLHSQHTWKEV